MIYFFVIATALLVGAIFVAVTAPQKSRQSYRAVAVVGGIAIAFLLTIILILYYLITTP